jgi:Bacterioferritin (cytochrome b1)
MGIQLKTLPRLKKLIGTQLKDILEESLEHEMHAVDLYKDLLSLVEDRSIYLEEYARGMIGEEEQHSLELKKMLKDFG